MNFVPVRPPSPPRPLAVVVEDVGFHQVAERDAVRLGVERALTVAHQGGFRLARRELVVLVDGHAAPTVVTRERATAVLERRNAPRVAAAIAAEPPVGCLWVVVAGPMGVGLSTAVLPASALLRREVQR